MFIRPFDIILWDPETAMQTLIVEDSSGNLYRHTTNKVGIHITEVEGWERIEDFEDDWISYLETFSGFRSNETLRMRGQVTEKIRLHMHPPKSSGASRTRAEGEHMTKERVTKGSKQTSPDRREQPILLISSAQGKRAPVDMRKYEEARNVLLDHGLRTIRPPVPERSQGDVIFEIIETLLEEAIESRDDDPQVINGYAIGYDDGKVAGLRTALRSIKDFLD